MDPRHAEALIQRAAQARDKTSRSLLTVIMRLLRLLWAGDGYTRDLFVEQATGQARESAYMVAEQAREIVDQFATAHGVTAPDRRPWTEPDDPGRWAKLPDQFWYHQSQGKTADEAAAIVERETARRVDNLLTDAADRAMRDRMAEIPEIVGYRRVLHPELSAGGSCGLCAAASTRTYKADRLEKIHDGCVAGDTIVGALGVKMLTRRYYPGPLVVLRTALGKQLSITPNHPVLTDQGWVPAQFIEIGDQVVGYRADQRVVRRGPDQQQAPSSAEDVWRAATVDHGLRARRVPLSAEDLHGDGGNGEVDVVSTDGLLPDVGDVTFREPVGEELLPPRRRSGLGFAGLCSTHQTILWLWYAANGLMRSRSERLPFAAGELRHSDELGGAASTAFDGLLGESASDNGTIEAEVRGDRQLRLTGDVSADDFVVWQAQPLPSRFDPAFTEFAGEGRHAYAQLGRDLRDRLAGQVEIDSVIDKSWVEGPHHVYNLHSAQGWYSAHGVIVSNCHCGVLPLFADDDPETLNLVDSDLLASLYRQAGGTGSDRLSRLRVVRRRGRLRIEDTRHEQERQRRQDALGIDLHGDELTMHEVAFIERFLAAGETLDWIARDPQRRPTNDFIWTSNAGIAVEVKSTEPRFDSIRSRINMARWKAAKHGVVKNNFVIDLGDAGLTDDLRRQLATLNHGRQDRINELWVMTRGSLIRIDLEA